MSEKQETKVPELKSIILNKGDVLFKEGMEANGIFYIKEGKLVASICDPLNGKEKTLGNLTSGELVGEMSYLDGHPRCATVTAVSKTVLVEIPEDKFSETVNSQPPWLRTLVKVLVARLRTSNSKAFHI